MIDLNNCLDSKFAFQKHLHLNDVSFEEALDVLQEEERLEEDTMQLLVVGTDYSSYYALQEDEYSTSFDFIKKYTKLPLYSYGDIQGHKYLIPSIEIEEAFSYVKSAVDSFQSAKLTELSKSITSQDFSIQDIRLHFYTGDENNPKREIRLDTLGLYEYGKLRISGGQDILECDSRYRTLLLSPCGPQVEGYNSGYAVHFISGPQIIIDSKKISNTYSSDYSFTIAVVALHELMHALLDPCNHNLQDNMNPWLLYKHQKEEAWANALMLKAISAANLPKLMTYAINFVKTQPKECGYQYGLKFYKDLCNGKTGTNGKKLWEDWIDEKANCKGRNLNQENVFYNEVMSFDI